MVSFNGKRFANKFKNTFYGSKMRNMVEGVKKFGEKHDYLLKSALLGATVAGSGYMAYKGAKKIGAFNLGEKRPFSLR